MNRVDTAGACLAYLAVGTLCVAVGRLGTVVGAEHVTIAAGAAAGLWAVGASLLLVLDL